MTAELSGNVFNGPYPATKTQDGGLPPQRPDVSPKGKELGLTPISIPHSQED